MLARELGDDLSRVTSARRLRGWTTTVGTSRTVTCGSSWLGRAASSSARPGSRATSAPHRYSVPDGGIDSCVFRSCKTRVSTVSCFHSLRCFGATMDESSDCHNARARWSSRDTSLAFDHSEMTTLYKKFNPESLESILVGNRRPPRARSRRWTRPSPFPRPVLSLFRGFWRHPREPRTLTHTPDFERERERKSARSLTRRRSRRETHLPIQEVRTRRRLDGLVKTRHALCENIRRAGHSLRSSGKRRAAWSPPCPRKRSATSRASSNNKRRRKVPRANLASPRSSSSLAPRRSRKNSPTAASRIPSCSKDPRAKLKLSLSLSFLRPAPRRRAHIECSTRVRPPVLPRESATWTLVPQYPRLPDPSRPPCQAGIFMILLPYLSLRPYASHCHTSNLKGPVTAAVTDSIAIG